MKKKAVYFHRALKHREPLTYYFQMIIDCFFSPKTNMNNIKPNWNWFQKYFAVVAFFPSLLCGSVSHEVLEGHRILRQNPECSQGHWVLK